MAGDGQTYVEIGSAFLPSKEAAMLLTKYEEKKHVKVAISYSNENDVHKLFDESSSDSDEVNLVFIRFVLTSI